MSSQAPPECQGNSSEAQRALILFMLRKGSVNTFDARENGIMHPGGRIMELRRLGYVIDMIRVRAADASGKLHWIGCYFLRAEPGGRRAA